MKTPERWLNTGRAAEVLTISPSTLRRWVAQGLIAEATHYRKGRPTPTSPWKWEVNSLASTIERATARPARPASLEGGPTDD